MHWVTFIVFTVVKFIRKFQIKREIKPVTANMALLMFDTYLDEEMDNN